MRKRTRRSKDVKYPAELIVRVLRPDEWHLAAQWFEDEYGILMPLPDNTRHIFYGAFIGERIVGFSHLECIVHLSKVYVDEEHRSNGTLMRAIFETMDGDMPPLTPVLIFPDKRFARLMNFFGFRDWGVLKAWRKDY